MVTLVHRRRVGSTVAALVMLAVAGATATQTPVPGLGTWKLNLAKSKYSPGPAPKTAIVTFSMVGQAVRGVIDGIGPDGAKTHWEYTAAFDGKPHAVTGNPDGDMVTARVVNATTVETRYTLKGKPTTVNLRVVSADGTTLTVTTTGVNGQGQAVANVQVFER